MNTVSDSSPGTRTCASASPRRVFRVPLAPRLLSLFTVVFSPGIAGIMIGFAVIAFAIQWVLGLFMLACAGFIGGSMHANTDAYGRQRLGWSSVMAADTAHRPSFRRKRHRPSWSQWLARFGVQRNHSMTWSRRTSSSGVICEASAALSGAPRFLERLASPPAPSAR